MRIITWNIRHGGGTRVDSIIRRLINKDADLVVITEYRNNENGVKIRQALLEAGYLFQYCPITDKDKNTLLIVSRINLSGSLFKKELQEEFHRVVRIESDNFALYGMYFPQKQEKKKVFEFMLSQIGKNPDRPIIFIGDFNTGKQYIDEEKNTFYCSEYMDMIVQQGLVDAWRYINDDKREYSWYSNAGNGFRIDHIFVSNGIKDKVQNCYYSHAEREDKVSDHSMMVMEIDA